MKMILHILLALITCSTLAVGPQAAVAAVGDKEEAVLNCTDLWMEHQFGVPHGQTAQYYDSSMMSLGGPRLIFYVHFISGCLGAKHWRLGDTRTVGNSQAGTPLMTAVAQVAAITHR